MAAGLALEVEFRGAVRKLQWDVEDEATNTLGSLSKFSKTVSGVYGLPPAWSARHISYLDNK